ncbi:MAG: DUF58 domain-containing protein [Methanobacteriota archaeon]|nr:MAG: DUF58 domain-containing protein [Euryarchaeota archaeon]
MTLESSPLGKTVLIFCAVFVLAAYLFMSMSWIVVCSGLLVVFVYSRRRFLEEVDDSQIKIDRRVLDELMFAKEPVAVKVEITNLNSTALEARFEDRVPDGCTVASGSNVVSAKVPARSVWSFTYSFVPERRGSHVIGGIEIEQSDAFGLHVHKREVHAKTTVLVHTRRESVSMAREAARKEHFEYVGVNKTLAVVLREFEHAGIREYVPGDKARDVNWKALSRLGRLMTNAYNKEGTLETMVMIDCSRSMRLASYKVAKIDHATDLALQLSRALLSNYHRTGVTAFDETSVISSVDPSLSKHQFEKILIALGEIPGSVKVQENGTAPDMTRRKPPLIPVSKDAEHDRGEAFLDALSDIAGSRSIRVRELGLEGAVGDMILRRRGREMLFVIISDLVSSRESVVSAANLCRRTGNRALVIQTYDDWYSKPRSASDLAEAELLYSNIDAAVGVEATLRRSGASFLRVGPADTTARIVRSIRRGVA